MSVHGKIEQGVENLVRRLIGEHAAVIDSRLEAAEARIVALEDIVNTLGAGAKPPRAAAPAKPAADK